VTQERIMSFEDFMRPPRSDLEIPSYHRCLAALKRIGMVREDLTIVKRRRRRRDEA
jgi:hypothetical protein